MEIPLKTSRIKEETPKSYNFGLGFLKMILAFKVIVSHCYNYNSATNKLLSLTVVKRKIHVPSFFIMSFYYILNVLMQLNFKLLYKRIVRLSIPYLGWPIIIYIINNAIICHIFNFRKISFADLKSQLLWGNNYIIQLWFQWDLIFITILFFIIIFIFGKHHLFIFHLLAIVAYFFQYSGYNLKFYLYCRKECLGRFIEMIPYAVTGFTLAFFKMFDYLNKNRKKTLILSSLIFIFVGKYEVFKKVKGVVYSGLEFNVRAVSLVFFFSVFPSEYLQNKKLINIIRQITNFTAGIFYLHYTVYIYLKNYIQFIKNGTFLGCVFIYLISYLISFFSLKFAGKTIFKNLFS